MEWSSIGMKDLQQLITEKVGVDKLLHFALGGWIACLAPNWYTALLIGLLIGLLKELSDKYIKKSVFDYWDWLATFLGSVITAVVLFISNM